MSFDARSIVCHWKCDRTTGTNSWDLLVLNYRMNCQYSVGGKIAMGVFLIDKSNTLCQNYVATGV